MRKQVGLNRPLRVLAMVLIAGCGSAPETAQSPRSGSPFAVATPPLTTTAKPSIDTRRLEKRTHELVNAERVKRGLQPLEHIDEIGRIARSHSKDMADRNYFGHNSPEGRNATDRAQKGGYDCRKDYGSHYTYGLGENLATVPLFGRYRAVNGRIVSRDWFTPEGLAREAVKVWMEREEHRENILNASYDRAGIGVAVAKDGKVYFTQNFC